MNNIKEYLKESMQHIYKNLEELEHLNKILKKYLPQALKDFIKVASFTNGKLILILTEQTMAVELRFFLPKLRDLLRINEKLYALVTIKVIFEHKEDQKIFYKKMHRKQPPQMASEIILEASAACTHAPLKCSLTQLANTLRTKSLNPSSNMDFPNNKD